MGTLGATLAQSGHHAEAMDLLGKAMRASPHDPLYWGYTFWIGITSVHSCDFAAALETMRQAVRLHPGHANAYEYVAGCLAYLGRLNEARETLERARARLPDHLRRYQQAKPRWVRPEDYTRRMEGVRLAAGETP